MLGRILLFVLCQALAAGAAWLLLDGHSRNLFAALAALAACWSWLLLDALRGQRLMDWLRSGDTAATPLASGFWGELFERARKLVRQRERAAAQADSRLQDVLAALQASPNGVMLLDAEGRIEWLNQTAAAHFALDAGRDLQQHLGNLVRDPALAAYFAAHDFSQELLLSGRAGAGGLQRRLSVQVHPYGDGRNLMLSRDITAMEQAESMRRDFVANVSHEVRTPLTVLAGFVETLQTLPLDEAERARYLDLMAVQAERMQTLVNDLLTLSRLEGSPLPPAQDWHAADTLLGRCAQEARDLSTVLWGQPRELHIDAEPGLELAGSLPELHSAMSNLIGNAVRYSAPDKPIEVALHGLPSGGALFSVKDQGQGIAPEHLPRLTERFYRVDRSRSRETGGTGLGLAIVKHVAQRHGAELHIESTPGKGSCFSISFAPARVRRVAALSVA